MANGKLQQKWQMENEHDADRQLSSELQIMNDSRINIR